MEAKASFRVSDVMLTPTADLMPRTLLYRTSGHVCSDLETAFLLSVCLSIYEEGIIADIF